MSTLARTTALALLAACTSDPSPSPGGVPASRDDGAWIYTVRAGEGARVLEVTAEFPGHTARRFAVDPEAAAFVEDAAWWDGAAWLPLARGNDEWTLPSGAGGSPRLRYRFRLEEAARAIDSPSTAAVRMDCLVGPPSAWTLRPTEGSTPRVVLQVETPADVVFATGIFRDPGDPGVDGNTYVIPSWFLPHAPFTAFGPFMSRSLSAGGSEILVVSPPPPYQMPADLPLDWVEEAAAQVADYFDGFPVPRVLVHLHRRSGFASTLGNGGASIDFPLGRRPRVEKFEDDWVMAHEMVHLGFPSVAGRHRWIEEGTASYVEPVARVRTGDISREAFWSELVRNLPRGQPRPGQGGLDGASTIDRIYWGGALYCFRADVETRRRTDGRRGLEHALRGIVSEGGRISVGWSLEKALEAGDRATGVPVLAELYDEMGAEAVTVDLDALWENLGVRSEGGLLTFDDGAPWAGVRRAIDGS